jgi:hypothetical protein
MLDGDPMPALGPPPEVQPGPPGGVLGGPDLTPSGDGIGYHPTDPAGGDFPPPPPEGDPNLIGMYPGHDAVGPAPVAPTDPFA